MRRALFLYALFLSACQSDAQEQPADSDPGPGETAPRTDTSPPVDTSPPSDDPEELSFAAFEPWASPIEDYIAINQKELGHDSFMKGIYDLEVFEDRLYLGYGDATLNLGRITPIELRYWSSPQPEDISSEFTTDEEAVDRFRRLDDLLMVPGVDATEDDFMGNAYFLPTGGEWSKSRTLEMAWHVHDVARLGDQIYACGSGGTEDDYNESDVNAYLYVSDDGGESFRILQQLDHPDPPGDNRFTSLLAVDGQVQVFGYYSDFSAITGFHNLALEDEELTDIGGMSSFFTVDTLALNDEIGLAMGVQVSFSLKWRTKLITANGSQAASVFDGYTPLDGFALGDGRALLLMVEGEEYPMSSEAPWDIVVGLTHEGEDFVPLHSQSVDVLPHTVAFWQHALYLGLDDGTVWQAQGE